MRAVAAFWSGVCDGYQQGELCFGRTYDNSPSSPCSRAYDHGATWGERVAALAWRLRVWRRA